MCSWSCGSIRRRLAHSCPKFRRSATRHVFLKRVGSIALSFRFEEWNSSDEALRNQPERINLRNHDAIRRALLTCTVVSTLVAGTSANETQISISSGPASTTFTQQSANNSSIAVVGDEVHVAWMEQLSGGTYNVLHCRSVDGGQSFGPIGDLSQIMGGWGAFSPTIAASGREVHVAWLDARHGAFPGPEFEVYYRRSLDSGQTWLPRQRVAPGLICENVDLAISGSVVNLVFQEGAAGSSRDIVQIRSIDGGATFRDSRQPHE